MMYQGARIRPLLSGGMLLGLAALALTGCATDARLVQMTPFTRGVLLVYDGSPQHCARKSFAESLLYLELETGKPRTVTVRAFDDHDRPMSLDPKLIAWSAGVNVSIVPQQGSATVQVTLLNGDGADLVVATTSHTGQLRIRRKT